MAGCDGMGDAVGGVERDVGEAVNGRVDVAVGRSVETNEARAGLAVGGGDDAQPSTKSTDESTTPIPRPRVVVDRGERTWRSYCPAMYFSAITGK
jgi:hypothetical protein